MLRLACLVLVLLAAPVGADLVFGPVHGASQSGEIVVVSFTIENTNDTPVEDVVVLLRAKAPSEDESVEKNSRLFGRINENDEVQGTIEWEPSEEGEHQYVLILDPDDTITEADENNNIAAGRVTVSDLDDFEIPWGTVIAFAVTALIMVLALVIVIRKSQERAAAAVRPEGYVVPDYLTPKEDPEDDWEEQEPDSMTPEDPVTAPPEPEPDDFDVAGFS